MMHQDWKYSMLVCLMLVQVSLGQLQFESRELEVTASPDDKQVTAEFVFHNAGENAVTIKRIRSSCDCTTAGLEKNTYQPEEDGRIVVTFNVGERTGLQRKQVLVQTDDPAESTVVLTMKAQLPQHEVASDDQTKVVPVLATESVQAGPPPLQIIPRLVVWTAGEEATSKEITIKLKKDMPLKVLGVELEDDRFTTELREVAEGEAYVLRVTPVSTEEKALARIKLTTDPPGPSPHWHQLFAVVRMPGEPIFPPATEDSMGPSGPARPPAVAQPALSLNPRSVSWVQGEAPEPKRIDVSLGPDAKRITRLKSDNEKLLAVMEATEEGQTIVITPADTVRAEVAIIWIEAEFADGSKKLFQARARVAAE
jgi:hypothetical protein